MVPKPERCSLPSLEVSRSLLGVKQDTWKEWSAGHVRRFRQEMATQRVCQQIFRVDLTQQPPGPAEGFQSWESVWGVMCVSGGVRYVHM